MLLVYDAKCGFCSDLALRLRDAARREPIELRPLTDPVARATLDRHYPDGWEDNFYVVRAGRCYAGRRVLRPLLRAVGPGTLARAAVEYARFRTRRNDCPAPADGVTGGFSRRSVVAAGLAAPAAALLRKLPSLPARLGGPDPDLAVARALVTLGPSGFAAVARALPDAVREVEHYDQKHGPTDVRSTVLEDVGLLDEAAGAAGRITIRRTRTEYVRDVDSGTLRAEALTHMAMLQAPRYSVVVNVGRGPAITSLGVVPLVTMSAMVKFDNPYPVVDSVVVEPKGSAAEQLSGYATGVVALADLHEAAGRVEAARLYREVAVGVEELAARFAAVAPASLAPMSGEMVMAATSQSMRFVAIPPPPVEGGVAVPVPPEVVQILEQVDGAYNGEQSFELSGGGKCKCQCECGCDCCCQCSCGCGCECGFGCCNCGCACGCCCGCGCGCSCGCGCCYSDSLLSDAELAARGVPVRRFLTL